MYSAAGYQGKCVYKDFAIAHMQHEPLSRLSERTRHFISRAKALVLNAGNAKVLGKTKHRRLMGGGRPPAAELEYGLFNWYLDHYKATTQRIWPSTLKRAAEVRGSNAIMESCYINLRELVSVM